MTRTLLLGIGLSLGAQVFTSDVRLVVVDANVRDQAGPPIIRPDPRLLPGTRWRRPRAADAHPPEESWFVE